MLAALAFSIAISIDVGISKHFNLAIYCAITFIIPLIFIAVGDKIKPHEVMAETKSPNRKYYLITGIAWALTIIFSLRSFQLGNVSTIISLQSVTVLLNVIIATIVLKERTDILKKILAAVLVIIGVYMTVM